MRSGMLTMRECIDVGGIQEHMKKYILLSLLVILPQLTGCESRKEGPLERAGREVDDAVDDLGEKKKSTSEKVGEEIKELGDKIEDRN